MKQVINHIGISGGKDSTALLLWAVHRSGYDPKTLDVTFCDTGNEHQITYDYVDYLRENVFPGIKTLKPERGFYDLAFHKKRFPAMKSRFCTQELKIFPTQDHVYGLMNAGNEVLLHSGVRAAESFERSKLLERGRDEHSMLPVYRPLLTWTLADVWAIHKEHGIKPNPLYSMGAKRVGCYPCIYSRKEEIRNVALRWPERIDMIRQWEQKFEQVYGLYSSFFCRDKVPLRFRTKEWLHRGIPMMIACIDDVVRWSLTGKRAKGSYKDDPPDPVADADRHSACSSSMGQCE